jgi:hypothetical protein
MPPTTNAVVGRFGGMLVPAATKRDFATGEALIENVKRRGTSFAAGRPISHPDNNRGDPH